MPPLRDDQYISLSPTDSPADDAEIDSGAAALGPALQEECPQVGKGLTRLPADTPRTPGPRSVDFQQFCDRLQTDLPGDSHGRGSFDTSARFVAGDPGAKFGAAAPLEYEVTGEIDIPLGVDLWFCLAAVWISGGISHRICHGEQPRVGKPQATRSLPASLAGSC